MAEGKDRRLWDHTSMILWTLSEPHRDPEARSKPYAPWEFHPYELAERGPVQEKHVKIRVGSLKGLFEPGSPIVENLKAKTN